jgi:hypothetical protein
MSGHLREEIDHFTQRIGGCPREGLDDVEKRIISPQPGI